MVFLLERWLRFKICVVSCTAPRGGTPGFVKNPQNTEKRFARYECSDQAVLALSIIAGSGQFDSPSFWWSPVDAKPLKGNLRDSPFKNGTNLNFFQTFCRKSMENLGGFSRVPHLPRHTRNTWDDKRPFCKGPINSIERWPPTGYVLFLKFGWILGHTQGAFKIKKKGPEKIMIVSSVMVSSVELGLHDCI